jgi:hypothetical protein
LSCSGPICKCCRAKAGRSEPFSSPLARSSLPAAGAKRTSSDKACGQAPAALAGKPALPAGFPSPTAVVYTGRKTQGPTTIVSGYWNGDLDAAFNGYRGALSGAAGYSVTHDEQEKDDAEVNFSGHAKTGQVKLKVECEGRTTVTLTIRPE